MSLRSAPLPMAAGWLDFLLYSSRGKSYGVEGLISWNMIADEECSILISRYADFFSLVLNIVNADNWRAFTLQDLFLSVDSMERKYKRATSEDAWLNVKHDILFQMYLCVLREAVGLPDDSMLPYSLEEFHIPDTVSVARYRRKVGLLMEKYKGYYMQERSEEQATSVLHPAFTKQRDSLIYGVVNESINSRGAQDSVLNKEKVFELLEAHHTDVILHLLTNRNRQRLKNVI